jgi:hypothetical protein
MAMNWDKLGRDTTPKGWTLVAVELQPEGAASFVWNTGVEDDNQFSSVLITHEDVAREGKRKLKDWMKRELAGHARKLAKVRRMAPPVPSGPPQLAGDA